MNKTEILNIVNELSKHIQIVKIDGKDSIVYSSKFVKLLELIPTMLTKVDMVDTLTEIQMDIHELANPYPHDYDNLLLLAQHNAFYDAKSSIEDLVDEKINALRAKIKSQESEGKK